MLEMSLPDGRRKYATLVGLSGAAAKLVIGEREYAFSLAEVDALWSGSFVLLWKPPFTARILSFGDRGKEVAWVRQALSSLEGKAPENDVSDLFDEDLRQRIIDFQRSRSLPRDGIVGNETLVRMAMALEGKNAPSLSRPN
jgi:general secretion pathway protein A